MSSPCPRCGATRTDSVPHSPLYNLAWAVGYRLCRCSRCRLPRFMRKHQDESPNSLQLREEAAAGPHVTEERRSPRIAGEVPTPEIIKDVTSADSSSRADGAIARFAAAPSATVLGAAPWNGYCCAQGWPAAKIAGRAFPSPAVEKRLTPSSGEEEAAGRHVAEEKRIQELPKRPSRQ